MRPTEKSARSEKAVGEKSKSVIAQPVQRSVIVTVVLLPWSGENEISKGDRELIKIENSHK